MIICIVGPTGVGKTKLSIELAKRLNGEIINADSTQVYKNLDIATAKVTEQEKENIPHHLFDIKEITEDYSVFDYQKDGREKIKEILNRKKTPIIVGGTGLYIKALLYDYKFSEEIKVNIDESKSTDELYQELVSIDPNTDIHHNNKKRIIRALEYYYSNKKPISSKVKTEKLLYDTIFIGLNLDREKLYERINKRVDVMVENGLIEEAKKIYDTKIRTKAVMTPIGYKELFDYFDNKITLKESLELIKQHSRNYAKKQFTWNRHQLNVNWFDVNLDNFEKTIDEIIYFINKKTLIN